MPQKHQNLLTEKQQERLYLVHHMHHVVTAKGIIHQELHHCFLFEKKNMQGKKYSISHLISDRKLYHIVNKISPKILYDHLNNPIRISKNDFDGKNYSYIDII